MLTDIIEDIVHGDVKCENVLVFDKKTELAGQHDQGETHVIDFLGLVLILQEDFSLYCKLTDFGVSRHPKGGIILGGSRPWQAPECTRSAYFLIEAAKRTDVYSFGMLLWRVMLDGDPFKSLGDFRGKTVKEQRHQRNDAVTALKDEDSLVQHVCKSLTLSERFSRRQLEMLCEVIEITLAKDPRRRELDMARIIRLLTPNNWYETRHPIGPQRISMDFDVQLLDIEKHYSELKMASPVVHAKIAQGFRDYAQGAVGDFGKDQETKKSAAAYQLAICYANGFGVPFQPSECLRWLEFAADRGSQKAQEALPKIFKAFESQPDDFINIPGPDTLSRTVRLLSIESSTWHGDEGSPLPGGLEPLALRSSHENTEFDTSWTLLKASSCCRYDILDYLLSKSTKSSTSYDGISPIHFFSSWKLSRAESIGRQLVEAGADINANATRGMSIGGTPLMWSVYGDHLRHSEILLKLGGDPMVARNDGVDALSLAAQLHLTHHLRLLLENVRPAQVRGHLRRLVEAAASGESRYVRLLRHLEHWKSAAVETLRLLRSWNALFPDAADFNELLLPALHSSLRSSEYGRMNADVQIAFIDESKIDPSRLTRLLQQSVIDYNQALFEELLDRRVPASGILERNKSLLHLCAKIPDHILASTVFAPRLLDLGADLEAVDETGLTPWMEAVLERKWSLADLYLSKGAKPLAANNEGYNVLGLTIKTINVGAIKYLLKYCAAREAFLHNSFLINAKKEISALQLASGLSLPLAHAMKAEVMGAFLLILANFGQKHHVDFRSDGILPNATALEIAAFEGNVHPVKNLTKNGAHLKSRKQAIELAKGKLSKTREYLERKNLERCIFILQHWDDEGMDVRKVADDWTNLRTIDESHVRSSWELIAWDFVTPRPIS